MKFPFQNSTVESITAPLQKMIAQLNDFAEVKAAQRDNHLIAIQQLQETVAATEVEIVSASRTASKLRTLLD